MSTTFVVNTNLTTVNCGGCGGTYAIQERYRQECYQEGKSWTCPYCRIYWGYEEGETDKLKKQVANLIEQNQRISQNRDYHQKEAAHFRHSRDAIKGIVTKIKKRVGNGVCPCCKRTFQNLHDHIKRQHPAFAETEK